MDEPDQLVTFSPCAAMRKSFRKLKFCVSVCIGKYNCVHRCVWPTQTQERSRPTRPHHRPSRAALAVGCTPPSQGCVSWPSRGVCLWGVDHPHPFSRRCPFHRRGGVGLACPASVNVAAPVGGGAYRKAWSSLYPPPTTTAPTSE